MNVIKEIKEYKYAPTVQKKKKLDIAYGVDEKYLFASGISIVSILLNNDNSAFAFYVFTDFLDVDNESKFKKLAKNRCADINFYLIDCTRLKNLPCSNRLHYSAYTCSLPPSPFKLRRRWLPALASSGNVYAHRSVALAALP